MKSSNTIGLIIPTHTRTEEVLRALKSVQSQTLSDFQTVVVDNGPDAHLRRQIEDLNDNAKHKVTYLVETRLGLHYARHRGAHFLGADILVFTDDDATFEPRWLEEYARAFAENPTMTAAGGPVRPVWAKTPPKWLQEFMDHKALFPILSLMEPYHEFRLDPEGYFFGVNMAIRRKTLFEVGGFNPELLGSKTVGDGESGLNRKLSDNGYLIGYVPDAIVHHHIPPYRMTTEYIRKWGWHRGGAEMFARLHGKEPSLAKLFAEAIRNSVFYSPWWIWFLFARFRTDPFSLKTQLHASAGWCKMTYLWWTYTEPEIRAYLIEKDFIGKKDA